MSANVDINIRPEPDQVLVDIAEYTANMEISSDEAYDTARNCLMDTLGCGLLALRFPEATKHLGSLVPGTRVQHGARVPGTSHELDPVKAAWDIGALIRWLDFNDTWLAAEWGHPSDNLGAILAIADYLSRVNVSKGKSPLSMRDVLTAMIKAHEIQGVLALENSFNRVDPFQNPGSRNKFFKSGRIPVIRHEYGIKDNKIELDPGYIPGRLQKGQVQIKYSMT